MEDIKFKKVKLSPHSRDRVGLFARDYDRDIYLEKSINNPAVFETRAYPEIEEKYSFFRFNRDAYEGQLSQQEISELSSMNEKKIRKAAKIDIEEEYVEKIKIKNLEEVQTASIEPKKEQEAKKQAPEPPKIDAAKKSG